MNRNRFLMLLALGVVGCQTKTADKPIMAALTPAVPTDSVRLNWSPKAAAVPLRAVKGGLEGEIQLGAPTAPPIPVRLEKSNGSAYYDILNLDRNHDGAFGSGEILQTTPDEVRHKMWSSFRSTIDVVVEDPESGVAMTNPYPISLWYVEDFRETDDSPTLRFTRSGWMQGRVLLDGVEAHVRLSESELDGVFTTDDGWGLALPDSVDNLYSYRHERPAARHAWLGEKAYRLVSVNPTGRSVEIEAIDPGVTRAQEALDDDQMAVDRRAPHSGNSVAFRSDFDRAEADARSSDKDLFIDFETVWCGPCKSMDEWVYTADSVVEAAASHVAVKVDGDDFPELAKRFEVNGYPTMIRMTPGGDIRARLVGYQGVESMTAFLSGESR